MLVLCIITTDAFTYIVKCFHRTCFAHASICNLPLAMHAYAKLWLYLSIGRSRGKLQAPCMVSLVIFFANSCRCILSTFWFSEEGQRYGGGANLFFGSNALLEKSIKVVKVFQKLLVHTRGSLVNVVEPARRIWTQNSLSLVRKNIKNILTNGYTIFTLQK